jgi:hypothetical protein
VVSTATHYLREGLARADKLAISRFYFYGSGRKAKSLPLPRPERVPAYANPEGKPSGSLDAVARRLKNPE